MPRPPPSRAIAGCCTCTPRPSPRSSRPSHSATSLSSSQSSVPSSSSSHLPHHSQPFTTSSTQSATTTTAPVDSRQPISAPPVLDFLYPGFGFFSRCLPPLVTPTASSSSASSPIPGPSPPLPVADSTHDSPNYRSNEGRKILLSSTASSAGGLFGTQASWRQTVRVGTCVCGRVRETCLRCRGKSTSSVSRVIPVESTTSMRSDEKGKAKETQPEPNASPQSSLSSNSTSSQTSSTSPASTSTAPSLNPLSEFRTFFSSLDSSLPSSRTSSSSSTLPIPSASPRLSSLSPPRRRLQRKRSNLLSSSSTASTSPSNPLLLMRQLSDQLENDQVWNGLIYYEKLDSIRLFSRITKLVPTSSDQHLNPLEDGFPIQPQPSKLETDLRTKAGERIEHFLEKLETDRRNPEGRGVDETTKKNELSEAGLWIESFALRQLATDLEPTSELSDKFQESIRTVFGGWDQYEMRNGVEKKTRVQAIRTGLSSLFESWERTPSGGGGGGEAAFELIYDYDLSSIFETTLSDPTSDDSSNPTKTSKRRQEAAYNDILRRQYGLLLGRLKPSPVEWLRANEGESGEEELKTVPKGLHLVEFLARSGSAGEARKVWEHIEQIGSKRSKEVEVEDSVVGDLDEEARLKSLTALVDGLVMERLYEDANALTGALEGLAKRSEGGGGDTDRTTLELVLGAYRILAKLASNQSRLPILERLLKKVDTLSLRITSISPTSALPSPLESFARQLRLKSTRHDLGAVRTLFASFQATPEWEQASKEDQARLWSQVILAQTRINNVEGAVETLQSLVTTGLKPPLAAVNSILFGFARRGDIETVDNLFQQLVKGDFERLRPDEGSWNSLVLARTTVKDPSAASRVISAMRRGGAKPNRQTWTTLMSGLVDSSQWRQAFEVYRYLEQHPSIDMRPDTATTNVVLKACVLTATPASLVLTLFRQLLVRGFRPNMMTYTLVLQSLTSAGLMGLAEELYLMMDPPSPSSSTRSRLPTSMTPVRPDQFVFSTLIAGYLKRDERGKAKACLAEMRRRGIEPSSITLAIIVGSRLSHDSTPRKVQQLMAEARRLLKEEGSGGLTRLRKLQPSRQDEKLAMGDEAAVIFAPIFRAAAKQGLVGAALELLEEVQSRRKTDEVPVELYAMLIDAFRRVDDQETAAESIKTIWDRVYESVAERFMVKNSSSSSTSSFPTELTAHFLTTSRHDLRIDPVRASILCVPFTIFLESLARTEQHHLFGLTWRALARQGFAFDVSNWNTLAIYFARDLQLERAFWISEHVLCRPPNDDSPIPSPAKFEADLSRITRSNAMIRTHARLSNLRQYERDQQKKNPLDLQALFSTPSSPAPDLDISSTFEEALKVRESTFWHPYSTLLEALGTALETLTLTGDIEVHADEAVDGGIAAIEVKEQLVRDHPRTIKAIELWKNRGERKERERERFLSVQGRSL
ncbi:uncharacterized protein JCM6883_007018 [Sporobolomyces salmoneus]|uniref:uncharacterized protein n=1 Tax=Sporobolomyces salmoneus TaxID=183962 RepID=UPI00317BE1DE